MENNVSTPEQFNHREHLRIAYVLISKYGVYGAHVRMRSRIQAYLLHQGLGISKYHESMTRAWILAVHHFMHLSKKTRNFDEFITKNPVLLDQV